MVNEVHLPGGEIKKHKHMLRFVKATFVGQLLKFRCEKCGAVKYLWRTEVNGMIGGRIL